MQIEIDKIDGNFYSNLELVDVTISKNSNAIVSFSSLKLNYNVLALRNRKIVADTVLLKNPTFNIWQNSDSTWNFIELFSKEKKDTVKNRKPFKFVINANYVAIKNGSITVSTYVDLIPTSLTGLNIEVDGTYHKKNILAHLRNLSFQSENPTLDVKELSTYFNMNNNKLGVDSLILRTSASNIFIDANYAGLDYLNADIEASPINKQELAIFLPTLKLTCSPEIKAQIKSEKDSTRAQIELINGNQSILVDAQFHSLKRALKDKKVKAPFVANINFKNVAPEKWIEMKNPKSIINGDVELSGAHFFNYKLPIKVDANLKNSIYNELVFSKFLVTANYTNDSIETEIELQTENGGAKIEGNISNLVLLPVYNVSIITNSLNLTSFIPKLDSTILNAHIVASGEGFEKSVRNIKAAISLENSSIYKIPIVEADLKARMDKQEIFIDSLKMLMPGGSGFASGKFDIASNSFFSDVHLDVDSLSFLSQFITLPVSFKILTTDANIQGSTNDLIISGEAKFNNAEGYSVKLEEMETSFLCKIKKDSLNVKAKLEAITVTTEPVIWDTINAEIEFFDEKVIADIYALWKDTLNAAIKTKINLGDTLLIELPSVEAKTFFSHYYLADTLQ